MRRRFFNALCLLSLVMAIAVGALWVRSVWWAGDTLAFGVLPGTDRRLRGGSSNGSLYVEVEQHAGAAAFDGGGWGYWQSPEKGQGRWLPFYESWKVPGGGYGGIILAVPNWLALLVLLAAPVARAFVVRRARRRKRLGGCPVCGYDLRSARGATCPECGAATGVRAADSM